MADVFELMDEWGPEKVVAVSDHKTGMKGVLVIDNTARGMGKGGTRMLPTVSVGEIARLARVMTWKWAGVDLFYGGAKAGIQADPQSPYKEEILRAFVRRLSNEVPAEYVFGLDMGLTEDDAAVINDELGDRGAAVGTPYDGLRCRGSARWATPPPDACTRWATRWYQCPRPPVHSTIRRGSMCRCCSSCAKTGVMH